MSLAHFVQLDFLTFTGALWHATYRLADGGGLAERPRRTILL